MAFSFSGSKQKQKQESQTTAEKRARTTQTGTRATTGQQDVVEQQTTETLSAETRGILEQAIADIASGSVAAENLTAFVQDLQTRAGEAEARITAETGAIVGEARRVGEQQIGRTVTELAAATGSTQGSFVQQIALESQVGLESQLAALGSEFALKARDTQTQELQNVLSGLQAGVGSEAQQVESLAALSNILKGATTTATGTTAARTQETETSQVNKLVDELIKSRTKTKGKSKGGTAGFSFG